MLAEVATASGIAVVLSCVWAVVDWLSHLLTDLRVGVCRGRLWTTRAVCCAHKGDTYVVFVLTAIATSYAVSRLLSPSHATRHTTPSLVGSGITEVRLLLGGFEHAPFLHPRTLATTIAATALTVGGGVVVGAQESMVHVACCVAQLMLGWTAAAWARLGLHPDVLGTGGRGGDRVWSLAGATRWREWLVAASAAGFGVAFGAPIAGVMFSMEEVSPCFPSRSLLLSLSVSLISAVCHHFLRAPSVFPAIVVYDLHNFDVLSVVALSTVASLASCLLIALNRIANATLFPWRLHPEAHARACAFDTVGVTVLCAFVRFWNPLTRAHMPSLLAHLFTSCDTRTHPDWHGLCYPNTAYQEIFLLTTAAMAILLLCALAHGTTQRGGVLVPALCLGGCLGRAWGLCMQQLHYHHPEWGVFDACKGTNRCVSPALYAIVGAAATAAGVSRSTVTVAVMMFELTGQFHLALPILIGVMVSRLLADYLSPNSIWDTHTQLHAYPHIDNRKDFGALLPAQAIGTTTAADVMLAGRDEGVGGEGVSFWSHQQRLGEHFDGLCVLESSGEMTVKAVEAVCDRSPFVGYPVVTTREHRCVVGYVKRANLLAALKRAAQEHSDKASWPDAMVVFQPKWAVGAKSAESEEAARGRLVVDLSDAVENTPVLVEWCTPIQRLYDMFKFLCLPYVLVVSHGKLCGLITRTDLIWFLSDHSSSSSGREMFAVRSATRRAPPSRAYEHDDAGW